MTSLEKVAKINDELKQVTKKMEDLELNFYEKEYNRIKSLGYENFKIKNGQIVYEVEGEKLFKIKAPEGTEIEIRDTDI